MQQCRRIHRPKQIIRYDAPADGEFFQAFANEAKCNLHLELLYGDEPHHIAEALFKAFAKAVDFACQKDPRIAGKVPSTKGKL